MVEGDGFEPS
ncbi:hypothetical protein VCEM1626_001035A, partial [Vibrio cholerae O1 str. EM-1626]